MSDANSLSLKLAKTVAISASGILCGTGIGISAFAVPRVLDLPTTQQLVHWRAIYDAGAARMPPLAILTASSYLYVAYALRRAGDSTWSSYALSAGLCVSIVPFTIAVMSANIHALEARRKAAVEKMEVDKNEVAALVQRWGRLNVARSMLVAAATALGVWTALN